MGERSVPSSWLRVRLRTDDREEPIEREAVGCSRGRHGSVSVWMEVKVRDGTKRGTSLGCTGGRRLVRSPSLATPRPTFIRL